MNIPFFKTPREKEKYKKLEDENELRLQRINILTKYMPGTPQGDAAIPYQSPDFELGVIDTVFDLQREYEVIKKVLEDWKEMDEDEARALEKEYQQLKKHLDQALANKEAFDRSLVVSQRQQGHPYRASTTTPLSQETRRMYLESKGLDKIDNQLTRHVQQAAKALDRFRRKKLGSRG